MRRVPVARFLAVAFILGAAAREGRVGDNFLNVVTHDQQSWENTMREDTEHSVNLVPNGYDHNRMLEQKGVPVPTPQLASPAPSSGYYLPPSSLTTSCWCQCGSVTADDDSSAKFPAGTHGCCWAACGSDGPLDACTNPHPFGCDPTTNCCGVTYVPCPTGKYNMQVCDMASPDTGCTCTSCPAGYFSSEVGSKSCTGCLKGYFANSTGATNCTSCPSATTKRSTTCTPSDSGGGGGGNSGSGGGGGGSSDGGGLNSGDIAGIVIAVLLALAAAGVMVWGQRRQRGGHNNSAGDKGALTLLSAPLMAGGDDDEVIHTSEGPEHAPGLGIGNHAEQLASLHTSEGPGHGQHQLQHQQSGSYQYRGAPVLSDPGQKLPMCTTVQPLHVLKQYNSASALNHAQQQPVPVQQPQHNPNRALPGTVAVSSANLSTWQMPLPPAPASASAPAQQQQQPWSGQTVELAPENRRDYSSAPVQQPSAGANFWDGLRCDQCGKKLQHMNMLHTETFETQPGGAGAGASSSSGGGDHHQGKRLCGECSIGHCPECGAQMERLLATPSGGDGKHYTSEAALKAALGAGAGAGAGLVHCPACGYNPSASFLTSSSDGQKGANKASSEAGGKSKGKGKSIFGRAGKGKKGKSRRAAPTFDEAEDEVRTRADTIEVRKKLSQQ